MRRHADAFDALHLHIDRLHLLPFESIPGHTLTALHSRPDPKALLEVQRCGHRLPLAPIARRQQPPLPLAHRHGRLPPGLNESGDRFGAEPWGDRRAFPDRIWSGKRPDRAIPIARRAGIPLKIAAKLDPPDRDGFEQKIRPLLDPPLTEHVGEINDVE